MDNPVSSPPSAAGAASLELAEASAAAGVVAAQLGYTLTTEALKESAAVTVFPLLLLEITALGEGLAAYGATSLGAAAATAQVKASLAAGTAHWRAPSP